MTTPAPLATGSQTRALVRLSLPMVAIQVGMMGMGVVDTLMVGRVSAAALAAVALGNLFVFAVGAFGMGVLMSLDPVVAQAVGAEDQPAIARAVQRGLVLAGLMGVAASAILYLGEPILRLLGQPDEVVPLAAGYTRASIPGMFPFLAFLMLRQSLQAMSRTAPIIWAVVAANLVNVVLNWAFVFGHLGSPPLGAVGTGWATSIARVMMALGIVTFAWRDLRPALSPLRREAFQPRPLGRMLALGVPIGAQVELEFGAFALVALLMGRLGTEAMAAHQVAINLASLTFMVPFGVSAAAAVRVGQAIGRADMADARGSAWAALYVGGGFMVGTAAIFLLTPAPLARLYTDQVGVLTLAAALIPIAGVFQVFDGLQVVASGILRGTGDTRTPLVVNLIGFWVVGVPISVYLGFWTDAGPRGLWWGLVAGLGAVATFLVVSVRRRLGRPIERVLIDEVPSYSSP